MISKTENKMISKIENKMQVKEETRRGFEAGIDSEDIQIPRAKIVQNETENLKIGDILNTSTNEKLPNFFIPIFFYKTWIRFNPMNRNDPNFDPKFEEGKMIWMSRDSNDSKVLEQGKFGENGEPPIAPPIINVFSVFENKEIAIISFRKSSYKAGKKLLNLARLKGGDLFSQKYKIQTVPEMHGSKKYFVYDINPFSKVSDEEYQYSEKIWKDYHLRKIQEDQIDEEIPF